jgi:hypothetical protein
MRYWFCDWRVEEMKWISVKERLPSEHELVVAARWLYAGCDPDISVCKYYHEDFFAFTDGLEARNYDGGAVIVMDFNPTHWMPLPAAPEVEK